MSGDTLLRHWEMLTFIPQYPGRRSTGEIRQMLEEREYHVTLRTVQRDLEKLSGIFAYTCDIEARTNYWCFPRGAKLFEVPGMSSAAALALLIARENVGWMIPPTMVSQLAGYFERAEKTLANIAPQSLRRWKSRVAMISRGPKLRPAKIRDDVLHALYDAVLEQKKLKVSYLSRGATAAKDLTLDPLGLVVREGVLYVVATAPEYAEIRSFSAHRIKSAKGLDVSALDPKGFKFSEYVEKTFRYENSPNSINLKVRFDPPTVIHLQERPLSDDQIVTSKGGHCELTATVADTEELRWWLLGFGHRVEVLAPKQLRKEIAEHAKAMAERYLSG